MRAAPAGLRGGSVKGGCVSGLTRRTMRFTKIAVAERTTGASMRARGSSAERRGEQEKSRSRRQRLSQRGKGRRAGRDEKTTSAKDDWPQNFMGP